MLSVSPVLHDAVAKEIVALVADGVLGASQALGYIEMSDAPQVTEHLAISGDTAADLVVSIAGHGDAALQDAAGDVSCGLVLHGSHLSEIAAAVTDGSLSPEGAVHVIANLVAALASDPSATVRSWAVSQLDHYVDDGLVDAQTVSSVLMAAAAHATTTGLISLGAIMGTLGGGFAAIHDAIADGSLSAEQGMDLLLSIGAVRDIGDPVFQAARDEIVALVQDGALTGTQVLAVTRAAGAAGWLEQNRMSRSSPFPSSATVARPTMPPSAPMPRPGWTISATGSEWGTTPTSPASSPRRAVTFLKVQNGQMTARGGDRAHQGVRRGARRVGLCRHLRPGGAVPAVISNGAARTLTHLTRGSTRSPSAISRPSWPGASRRAPRPPMCAICAGGHRTSRPPTPRALTRAGGAAGPELGGGASPSLPEQSALARYMFANDLWVAQQVRLDSSPTSADSR